MWKFSAGDFARWPPEVTSNLIYCVILINIHSKLEEFLVVNVWGSSTAFPLLNHSHSEQFFFWIAVIIPLAAARDCCLSRFHCVPLRRVCLCFLYKFPLGPWRQQLDLFSLPFSRLNNLCSLHTSHNYSPWTFMLSHCCSLSYRVESFIPICSCARLDFLLTLCAWHTDGKPPYPILTFHFARYSTFFFSPCNRLLSFLITLAKFPSTWLYEFFTSSKDKRVLTGPSS